MICAVLILLSYSNPSFLGKLQINSCLNYSCLHAEDLSHGKTLITTTDMLFLSIKPTTLQVHKMDKHEPFVTPSHAHTPVSQGIMKKNKHDKSYTRFQGLAERASGHTMVIQQKKFSFTIWQTLNHTRNGTIQATNWGLLHSKCYHFSSAMGSLVNYWCQWLSMVKWVVP